MEAENRNMVTEYSQADIDRMVRALSHIRSNFSAQLMALSYCGSTPENNSYAKSAQWAVSECNWGLGTLQD